MCVWFVFVFSRFSLLCIVNPCGFAVLDCWLKGRLDWERWLEIVPWNRACWTLGCRWIPLHEPLWCRFRKCRVSMKKRLQGEREEGKRGMGQMDLKRKNIYMGYIHKWTGWQASSGKVHGVLGIIVDLNCLCQCLGVSAITLAWDVAAFGAARQNSSVSTVFLSVPSIPIRKPFNNLAFRCFRVLN